MTDRSGEMTEMNDTKLREAVDLCRTALADQPGFDERERTYKLALSGAVRDVLNAGPDDEEFLRRLRRAFRSRKNILTNFRAHDPFLRWAGSQPAAARAAVEALADATIAAEERAARFLATVPSDLPSQPGSRISVVAYLLMGFEPDALPVIRVAPFTTVERVLEWSALGPGATAAELYAHHLHVAQWLAGQLRAAGVPLRDMVDVQGLIRVLGVYGDAPLVAWRGGPPPDEDPPEEPLEELVSEFLADTGYPASFDGKNIAAREEYARYLAREAVAALDVPAVQTILSSSR